MRLTAILFLACALVAPVRAPAEEGAEDVGLYARAIWNYSSKAFAKEVKKLRAQGYRMQNIETYLDNGHIRLAAIFVENTDGREWSAFWQKSQESMEDKINEKHDDDYYLSDIEVLNYEGTLYYAGIMTENVDGRALRYCWNYSQKAYDLFSDNEEDAGHRPLDIEVYADDGEAKIAAIWIDNPENYRIATMRGLHADEYEEHTIPLIDDGYRPIDYESIWWEDAWRISAIWIRPRGGARGWELRRALESDELVEYDRQMQAQDYRLQHFDIGMAGGKLTFDAIWQER